MHNAQMLRDNNETCKVQLTDTLWSSGNYSLISIYKLDGNFFCWFDDSYKLLFKIFIHVVYSYLEVTHNLSKSIACKSFFHTSGGILVDKQPSWINSYTC